jgi:hypothetical protein
MTAILLTSTILFVAWVVVFAFAVVVVRGSNCDGGWYLGVCFCFAGRVCFFARSESEDCFFSGSGSGTTRRGGSAATIGCGGGLDLLPKQDLKRRIAGFGGRICWVCKK